jgi:hypothetical protein
VQARALVPHGEQRMKLLVLSLHQSVRRWPWRSGIYPTGVGRPTVSRIRALHFCMGEKVGLYPSSLSDGGPSQAP